MSLEPFVLLMVLLALWLLIGPALALLRISELRQRLDAMERQLAEAKSKAAPPPPLDAPSAMATAPAPLILSPSAPLVSPPSAVPPEAPPLSPPALPPPLPKRVPPPTLSTSSPTKSRPAPEPESHSAAAGTMFSWEQFVGVKLFAWFGGVALFFGIVFFVKYAFERELISPALRVMLGYLTALGLMVAGYAFRQRQAYRVLTQTLSATGILVFYGVTYAAHAWYQFPLFTIGLTFGLMTLITLTAFVTAARAKAEAVAVLGLLGGFLTPALVSSGQDQPLLLFGYVGLLNVGLVALGWREKGWRLLPLGAVGTAMMQWGWRLRFFEEGGYGEGVASWGMALVFAGFALAFALVAVAGRRASAERLEPWLAALIMAGSALLLGFDWIGLDSIACRPGLLYGLLAVASSGWLLTGWFFPRLWPAAMAGMLAVMLHLAVWMAAGLTVERLPAALAINLGFGLLHLIYLTVLIRRGVPLQGVLLGMISLAMLLLMGLPLVLLEQVSWLLWPPFLLAGGIALFMAARQRQLWVGLTSLAVTGLAMLRWLILLPREADSLLSFLVVLGFAVVVFAAGAQALQRWSLSANEPEGEEATLLRKVQGAALLLPFLLLALVPGLLPLTDPTGLLAAALGLSLTLQVLGRRNAWLGAVGWLGWLLVDGVWALLHLNVEPVGMLLAWHLGVPALAMLLWWIWQPHDQIDTRPVAAVGGLMTGCLALLHPVVEAHWPSWSLGLLPALFALPWLAVVLSWRVKQTAMTLPQRAWVAGLALWFATLIFPVQLSGHELSLAWALDAAALCGLFSRLRHDGLRAAAGLLAALACGQLLSQALSLPYAAAGQLPMPLWLGLVYGGAGLALLTATRWQRPPHDWHGELPLRALFAIMGGLLLFVMVNLQIAHSFAPVETNALRVLWGQSFACDMTYSIAWGLFALALLVIGFWKQAAGARYAGVGLLLVTLAKLFMHDLDRVGSIYRIAAFLAVAVIALGASFLYQKMAGKTAGSD